MESLEGRKQRLKRLSDESSDDFLEEADNALSDKPTPATTGVVATTSTTTSSPPPSSGASSSSSHSTSWVSVWSTYTMYNLKGN